MIQVIDQWTNYLEKKKKATSTINFYRSVATNAVGKCDSPKCMKEAIEEYVVNMEDLKESTIATRLHALVNLQEWMLKEKIMNANDAIDFKWEYMPSKQKKTHVKIITHEDQLKLFKAMNTINDKLAFTILLRTGIRISEFKYFENIDHLINNDFISVSGKSKSSRDIFICEDIKKLAKKFKKEKGDQNIWPPSYPGRVKRLNTLCEKTGLDVNLHMFRATFATEWIYKGHSIVQLQQAMGHSSLSQLEPYLHSNQLQLKKVWEEFSSGKDYSDNEFLRAENKMLKEQIRKLKGSK